MSGSAWVRDQLRASRKPLHCARCNKVIFPGERLFVEDVVGGRYACSPDCVSAVGAQDAIRDEHKMKRGDGNAGPYGSGAHSDTRGGDDPAF